MTTFLVLVITGAISGGVYAIMASGLVLTYTTTGIFNFAYGAQAFCGAYVFYQLNSGFGISSALAGFISILVFSPLLGLLLDITIYRKLRNAPHAAQIVASFGVLLALPNAMLLLGSWLTTTVKLPLASDVQIYLPPGLGPNPPINWTIARGAIVNSNQVGVLAAAVVVSLVLWVVLRKTRAGLRMRAAVDREKLASIRGISPAGVSTLAAILTSVLAGLAGVLMAPLFNLSADTFTEILFVSAAAAVIGRFRSIPWAIVGGLGLGIIQNLVEGYTPQSLSIAGVGDTVPFVVLLVGLMFVGRGRERVAGVTANEVPSANYLSDLSKTRRFAPWVVLCLGLIIWTAVASPYVSTLLASGMATGIIFLSFVLLTGAGGMVSAAQGALASAGAFVAAIVLTHGLPFAMAVIVGALVAGFIACILVIPALRLGGGIALTLATLAIGYICDDFIFQFQAISGGPSGRSLSRPHLFFISFSSNTSYAFLILAIFGVLALGVRNLLRSPTGRTIIALRSSEAAAVTAGASRIAPRLALFGISAFIAALGGILLAGVSYGIQPNTYTTEVGLLWVAIMVVFGVRHIGGALVAGLMSSLMPALFLNLVNNSFVPPILFGLGAITIANNPDGYLALRGLKARRRRSARRQKREGLVVEPGVEPVTVDTGLFRIDAPVGHTPQEPLFSAATGNSIETVGSTDCALQFIGLSAEYDGVEVLHKINLEIPKNEITVILGANGAGKSTLCSVAAGTHHPSAGKVIYQGDDVTEVPSHRRVRSGLFLAPEQRGIFPGLSVEDNVAVWLSTREECDAALERFPVLLTRRRIPAGQLSGGEQQMLALVSALQDPPQTLIADEPSLGLAPSITSQVFDVFIELHQRGTTVILVEEKAKRALELARFAVVMDRGSIDWAGPAADLSDNVVQDFYLGGAKTKD